MPAPTPTADPRPLPQTLSLESVHGAEAQQMLDRIARWRVAYPALHARFWVPRVQKPVCVLCGRVGPYLWKREDGQVIANISVITGAESAATRAMALGGPHALFHQLIEDGEVWFGW